ncbi:MAG: endolytic transglycosylase MltG [Ruminococcus sp.]|nr:endolytic transglycosylase MltG [Ruminococcus sp.]
MKSNDDLINNILNELDNNASSGKDETEYVPFDETPGDDPTEYAPREEDAQFAQEEPDMSYDDYIQEQPQEQYEPQYEAPQQQYYNDQEMYDEPERAVPAKKKKKNRKKKRSRVPGVLILTTLIFGVSIILSMVIIGFGKDMLGIGKSDSTKRVVIKEGATTEEIAYQLKDEGIIKSPKFFMLFSRMRKSDSLYIAGEHFIRPNMAYETIIQNLTTDEIQNKETIEITFPEGITLFEAADILDKNGICKRDDFIFNFNAGGFNFPFEDRLPTNPKLKFNRMEGYLFPDTYFFYQEMEPEKVCQKIYSNFNQKMTEDRYKKMEELDLSLDQLITFASIVQKEAGNVDEMPTIASVFWNRLRNKDEYPKLESNPTQNYANNVIKKNMEVLDKTMLDAYDTYSGTGLPPGAICSPGMEAIDAVLANFPTNYYFFYANVYTKHTRFAETYEQHLQNEEIIHQEEAEYEAAQQEAANNGQ